MQGIVNLHLSSTKLYKCMPIYVAILWKMGKALIQL